MKYVQSVHKLCKTYKCWLFKTLSHLLNLRTTKSICLAITCLTFLSTFDLNSQTLISPRLSYNYVDYKLVYAQKHRIKHRLAIGTHLSRHLTKRLRGVIAFNYYPTKLKYNLNELSIRTLEFNNIDFKLGIENSIFDDNTFIGVGIQYEYLYGIKGKRMHLNNIIDEDFENESHYGIEFSLSRRLKKVEIFFDAYVHLNLVSGKTHNVVFNTQTNFQLGVGLPINLSSAQ